MAGGLSYSVPFGLFLFLFVDTAIACEEDFGSFGFSKLGLTDYAVVLVFCNSWVNYEISRFS